MSFGLSVNSSRGKVIDESTWPFMVLSETVAQSTFSAPDPYGGYRMPIYIQKQFSDAVQELEFIKPVTYGQSILCGIGVHPPMDAGGNIGYPTALGYVMCSQNHGSYTSNPTTYGNGVKRVRIGSIKSVTISPSQYGLAIYGANGVPIYTDVEGIMHVVHSQLYTMPNNYRDGYGYVTITLPDSVYERYILVDALSYDYLNAYMYGGNWVRFDSNSSVTFIGSVGRTKKILIGELRR